MSNSWGSFWYRCASPMWLSCFKSGGADGTVLSTRPHPVPTVVIIPVGSLLITVFLQELRLLESSASCVHICKWFGNLLGYAIICNLDCLLSFFCFWFSPHALMRSNYMLNTIPHLEDSVWLMPLQFAAHFKPLRFIWILQIVPPPHPPPTPTHTHARTQQRNVSLRNRLTRVC